MSELLVAFEAFHFLRPAWLALLPVALVLWWRIRSRATGRRDPPAGIAPHLADALTVGEGSAARLLPIDGVTAIIVLTALAAAGPAWSRVPNPLLAQTAPLAIALEVSESMLSTDVAPSRLERARHKILDLVAARAGGRTALVAYAGSAHRVVPLTDDPAVLRPFLEGLTPEIMPRGGQNATAALDLARGALAAEEVPGAILFVLDDLDRADLPAFERHAGDGGERVLFLVANRPDADIGDLQRVPGAAVVRLSPDASDVADIERRVASAYREALARDERQKWLDRGWMLAVPALLLSLLWFRRGWTMRWSLPLAVALAIGLPEPARADGIADWFFTPDQQGRMAYDEKRYAEAAELFEDPLWQGHALFRAGRYADAAEVLSRLPTADAAFAEGMAHVRNRAYRDGIAAFETALERDPDHPTAARNLEIARAILAYVERVREQSDTGEESGIGADDVVFDNEAGRGAETTITGEDEPGMQTAEQWMRTVDTRAADFLRIRFALEEAQSAP